MTHASWEQLVAQEPCLVAALDIAQHHGGDGWWRYECFKDIVRLFRIVGAGAHDPALSTTEAYEVAVVYAASVLLPEEVAS